MIWARQCSRAIPANNLELQSDDIITIFSQSDVAVPQSQRARYIRLEGEVVRAGVYKVEEGELLSDVIKRAGGVTPQAYIYGTELTRESARVQQQKSIDELGRRTMERGGAPGIGRCRRQQRYSR